MNVSREAPRVMTELLCHYLTNKGSQRLPRSCPITIPSDFVTLIV